MVSLRLNSSGDVFVIDAIIARLWWLYKRHIMDVPQHAEGNPRLRVLAIGLLVVWKHETPAHRRLAWALLACVLGKLFS